MDIGQHRQAGILRQTSQNARSLNQPGAAIALDTGAVGLVVAGLEDEWNAEIRRDALNGFGEPAQMAFGLDDARTGDQEELALAHMHGTDFKRVAHEADFILIERR